MWPFLSTALLLETSSQWKFLHAPRESEHSVFMPTSPAVSLLTPLLRLPFTPPDQELHGAAAALNSVSCNANQCQPDQNDSGWFMS